MLGANLQTELRGHSWGLAEGLEELMGGGCVHTAKQIGLVRLTMSWQDVPDLNICTPTIVHHAQAHTLKVLQTPFPGLYLISHPRDIWNYSALYSLK